MKNYSGMFVLLFAMGAVFSASCNPEAVDPVNANNSTNSASSLYHMYSLGGTTWVLTAYHDTVSATNITPYDTLVFTDSTHYLYNGVPCTYAYYFYGNSQQTHL